MNEKKFSTIRLKTTHSYNRPEITITDSLQNEKAYKEKLIGYVEVKDVDYVTISTHVRYFIFDIVEKQWKFRTGGLLTKKHSKYVVLSNGKYSWSVQRETHDTKNDEIYETKFFKIMSKDEKNEKEINIKDKEIEQLKKDNQKLAEKLSLLLQNFNN